MFENVKIVMFDLDGTIYYGGDIILGANEAIKHCRDCGKSVFFLTNNSTKTRQQIFEKLQGMGINCTYDEVLTSGYVAALYAQRENLQKIYVCGSNNLKSELEAHGLEIVDETDAADAHNLLIGYDPDFNYEKMTKAIRVGLKADKIIACNKDRVFLGQGALNFPGCGGMVAPIEWCCGRMSDYVIGKPNTLMLDIMCEKLKLSATQVLVVGDTYESDILMANKKGCPSVLIGTQEYSDTVTIEHIGDLVHLLK